MNPTYMDLKSLSVILLAATLEGREDEAVHIYLDRRLDKSALESFKVNLEIVIREVIRIAKYDGRLLIEEEKSLLNTKQTALVALTTILIDLGHDISEKKSDISADYMLRHDNRDHNSDGLSSLGSSGVYVPPPSPLIGVVEVAW
eukprot:CAMPEP_0114339692 /NCGR_PEP_ID=MMETSP0101-20121206/7894_1 /TAXON_ID=38822 ORGANISM="Pteridomonas danica, Strain PT" /NCGR_SAMPLE_ID=MMETSP0101 /ASSEMBLY_ACC=CAM_ASM_000211 /LENGTH=144 /DNA_ID=CAMNT_0001472735 /DNA_START=739 /DNA_END=1170 /DNA_ORIENTATION=+